MYERFRHTHTIFEPSKIVSRLHEIKEVKAPAKNWNAKNAIVVLTIFAAIFCLSAQEAFAISAPTDVPGLQLWLDTSQPNSLYKDAAKTQPATVEGDKIAVWADLSGNGFDATNTNATTQPLLTLNKSGGFSGVKFSNTNLLSLGNPAALNLGNLASSTIFIVFASTTYSYDGLLTKGLSLSGGFARTMWLTDSGGSADGF